LEVATGTEPSGQIKRLEKYLMLAEKEDEEEKLGELQGLGKASRILLLKF